MADPPSPPWNLRCDHCSFYIVVNARGARGNDPGSGVQAAEMMKAHTREAHGKEWKP